MRPDEESLNEIVKPLNSISGDKNYLRPVDYREVVPVFN
jgi:hypothetical protein